MLWHQSLKGIHYRTLLIFQNKKTNKFEGQNMGGIKDMLSPSCQNMGGYITPIPPGFTPLLSAYFAFVEDDHYSSTYLAAAISLS